MYCLSFIRSGTEEVNYNFASKTVAPCIEAGSILSTFYSHCILCICVFCVVQPLHCHRTNINSCDSMLFPNCIFKTIR